MSKRRSKLTISNLQLFPKHSPDTTLRYTCQIERQRFQHRRLSIVSEMLFFSLFTVFVSVAAALPTLGRFYQTNAEDITVTLHPELPAPPPSEHPPVCASGWLSDEVYIINNPSGKCGTKYLEPCTESADKVGGLCNGTCVRAVNATTGDPAEMYGLSHPRINGGFFTLFNGTRCESDTMYFQYRAQRVGTGPVRYVQTVHEDHMDVSPFMSFKYRHANG